ncbi:hypothetical protein HPB47_009778 [Ixodes persulcatus]|uniref:Uncharacterized protein n=1 Tax=Ixodes persulcatus TaxID=34615 RepID=A0AC60P0W8_IXOPE|nr:hypothetical protein HPB47_009778 [Ixodes persulcatus]
MAVRHGLWRNDDFQPGDCRATRAAKYRRCTDKASGFPRRRDGGRFMRLGNRRQAAAHYDYRAPNKLASTSSGRCHLTGDITALVRSCDEEHEKVGNRRQAAAHYDYRAPNKLASTSSGRCHLTGDITALASHHPLRSIFSVFLHQSLEGRHWYGTDAVPQMMIVIRVARLNFGKGLLRAKHMRVKLSDPTCELQERTFEGEGFRRTGGYENPHRRASVPAVRTSDRTVLTRMCFALHVAVNHTAFRGISRERALVARGGGWVERRRQINHSTRRRFGATVVKVANLIDTPGCKIPKYDPFTIGVIPFTENLTRKHKFVKIRCTSSHAEFYSGFHLIPQLKRSQYNASSDLMNVLILGMDSVSRLNMNRRLPHSSRFVRESLEAFELVAYNKIGENTFPNLMALLSGLSDGEVTSMTKNRTFDHVPFLWTTFKRKGYQTVFMEEMPNWYLVVYPARKGFRRPTERLLGEVVLQGSIWQYGALLPQRPRGANKSSVSEHTDWRSRGQPTILLSIFASFPRVVESLRINRNRLTTPYDVHATIRSLTSLPDFDPRPTARGLNLFRQVPPWRTCEEAVIPFQFCACERAEERIEDNPTARPYALLSLAFINTEAQRHFPGMCATWTLDAVLDATIMRGVASKTRWFRVVFTTQPKGQFQVFGTLHLKVGNKKKPVEFVERMDWYSNRTRCLPPSVAQKLQYTDLSSLFDYATTAAMHRRNFSPSARATTFLELCASGARDGTRALACTAA